MTFVYTSPYLLPLLLASLISLTVSVYAWLRRTSSPSAVWLALLGLSSAEWAFAYALEIAGVEMQTKIFWGKIQYLGITTTPLFLLLFAFKLANLMDHLPPRRLFLLGVFPAISVVLGLTPESHSLIWAEVSIARHQLFSALDITHGPWFWAVIGYSYIYLVIGTYIILRHVGTMKGLYRGQTLALVISVIAPWLANALYITRLSPIDPLDLTPFAFTISVVGVAWGIFGFRLVDVAPVARDVLLENMREGLIVLNAHHRVVDINPAAGRMIGLPAEQAIGKSMNEIFSPWPYFLERFEESSSGTDVLVVGRGEARRRYSVRVSPLEDTRNHVTGRVMLLRDLDEAMLPEPRLAVRKADGLPAEDESQHDAQGKPKNSLRQALLNFFLPPVLENIPAGAANPTWAQSMERVLTIMMRLAALIGVITVALILPGITTQWVYAASIVLVIVFLWVLSFWRTAPLQVRINFFLVLIYGLAFVEVYYFGYSVEAFIYLIAATILGTLFGDLRGGFLSMSASLTLLSIFGWIISQGMHRSEFGPMPPFSFQSAMISMTTYLAVSTAIVASVNALIGSLNRAWQKETQALNLLQQERDLLEQRVNERTRDLAEARDQALRSRDEVLNEIAERKRAESLLQESELRFRQIVEAASDIIYRTDANGRFTYVNPTTLRIMGFDSEDQMLGLHFLSLAANEWRHKLKRFYDRQFISGEQSTYFEFEVISLDGERIWIGQNVQIIKEANTVVGFQAVARDITRLKEAQDALALSRDQALEASRIKTLLLSRVSHELRTPLSSILGYAELLKLNAFGPLNEEQLDASTKILESADYLTKLVNDLLDQAQAETKNITLRMKLFSPSLLLQKVQAAMELLAHKKGLAFEVELAPELPEMLYGDEGRLQQILINLAGNAIKFTITGRVKVRLYLPASMQWAMQVSDTGAGIPKEAQAYIFEPFRQVDNAITRQNRGTGLGLSITRQLVEIMGGSIHLESEPGHGSTFTITLPIHRKPEMELGQGQP